MKTLLIEIPLSRVSLVAAGCALLALFPGKSLAEPAPEGAAVRAGRHGPDAPEVRPYVPETGTTPAAARTISALETFLQLEPEMEEWVAAPLDGNVPPSARPMIVALDQKLKAEAIAVPRASANCYALADRICVICTNALTVHDQFAVRSPRSENNQIDGAYTANWVRLAGTYRNTIQGLQVQYRDTVERGPVFVRAVETAGIDHRDFPTASVQWVASKPAPQVARGREVVPARVVLSHPVEHRVHHPPHIVVRPSRPPRHL